MAVEACGRPGASARRKAKEAAVGAAARMLFYPTLLYNVVRSKVQAEFRWWDEVDQVNYIAFVSFPNASCVRLTRCPKLRLNC
jgi:atypical dual specificity phosphatase